MSELPSSWITVTLSQICEVVMGQSPDSSTYNHEGKGLPFFQGKAEFGRLHPSVRKWCSDAKKIAELGDILLSIRAPVGPSNIASEKCIIGRGLAALRAIEPIHQDYIFHLVRKLEPWLVQQGTGSTFAAVSGEFVRSIEVPLAPLNEQKHIADKLDAVLARVDACRDRLVRIPVILKRFRQSVLAAATSGNLTEDWREGNAITDEWTLVQLDEVASNFSYGTSAKSSKSGSVPVLRMGNIQDGRLDLTDLVYTSDSQEISKYQLLLGDVLFNRTNSPELVGKTAVFKGERVAIYAGYLIRIRCLPQLLPDYLNYCLGSPAGRHYCWQVKSDGVSQSNINARHLRCNAFQIHWRKRGCYFVSKYFF